METVQLIPSKIYHFHIPKTAGTTVNGWLNGCVHADRARPADFAKRWQLEWLGEEAFIVNQGALSIDYQDRLAAMKHYGVKWFDVLHGHISHLDVLPKNSFVFTILRNPVARTVSQFKDYKRLQSSDYGHKFQAARKVHDCARQYEFSEFIDICKDNPFFRTVFEDGMCRFILQDRYPFEQFNALDTATRAQEAHQFLEDHIDLVGITEDLPNVMRDLALALGQVPPGNLAHSNQTEGAPALEERESAYVRDKLCPADVQLYERVRNDWIARASDPADEGTSIGGQIAARLSKLTPITVGNEHVFDMNMPLIGQGFHPRDASGETQCCRWMGPGQEATLHIPAPVDRPLILRFYMAGWSDPRLVDDLEIFIDGEPAVWEIEDRNNVFHALRAKAAAHPHQNRVQTAYRTATFRLNMLSQSPEDPRLRGFNLWRYSYESVCESAV